MASSKTIDLGGGVSVDPMKLIDTRLLVVANSGGGKSRLLRRLCEHMVPLLPVIILDREGEFSTLREHHDVVLVGRDGEVATAVATAGKLARKLIELRVSAVIDLSDLSKQDKRKFVRLFLEALMALPRSLWGPTMIVVDEAHEFCPETGTDAESRPAVIALMDQGRKRGFGGVLATQRLSKLAKDAAGEANNLCIGRCAQDLDLARASGLLGFSGKSEWATMRDSKPGEFYAVGPAFEHTGVTRFRSGSIATTHPSSHDRHVLKPPAPSRKILAVAGELEDLQQQVEAEQSEMEALRSKVDAQTKEIAKLVASGRAGARAVAATDITEVDLQHARAEARAETSRELAERFRDRIRYVLGIIDVEFQMLLRENLGVDVDGVAHEPSVRPLRVETQSAKPPKPTVVRAPIEPAISGAAKGGGEVGNGAVRKILIALATHGTLGRSALGILTGLKCTTGSFRNNLGTIRGNGWGRDEAGGAMSITPAGRKALGHYTPLPSGRALITWWAAWCGSGAVRSIYDVLVQVGARGIERDDLGERTGVKASTGSFRNNLGRLRGVGIMVDLSRTRVALSPQLLEHAA